MARVLERFRPTQMGGRTAILLGMTPSPPIERHCSGSEVSRPSLAFPFPRA